MINGEQIKSIAESYIGKVKYVFGADNIEGGTGDCSSFTRHVYSKVGLSIGRDTQAQYTSAKGRKIDKRDLQTGDLVFFKNTYNSNHTDGVSHVGIYVGNNNFIHLSSKGVNRASLTDSYWLEHYLGAKHFDDVEGVQDFASSPSGEIGAITDYVGDWWTDKKEQLLVMITIIVLILFVFIFGALSVGHLQ